MDRRTILLGSGLVAVSPLAFGAALAQGVAPEKLPMLQVGTLSKQMSQLALERVTDPSLTTFAQLEIAEIDAIMQAFGASEPAPLTEGQAARLEAFRTAPDPDRLFVEEEIAAHEAALPIARNYAGTGEDPTARGGAIVAVASIETHLAMLRGFEATI
ncbi:DUF4142 domain-containing protein [Hasllibacter halocynthiae]|nr:DUF4142 domain-containing protein [Hasllibacter halocynthiae]